MGEQRILRTLRRVEGVTYWVLNNPREIGGFINSNIRGEWERDNLSDGVDSDTDDWLLTLPKRTWRLRILDIAKITLDPSMMARESFVKQLEKRSNEMRRSLSEYHIVIWPVVLRGEDYRLKDGYCRFTTLKKMGIGRILAYVGRF
jgi:hypothetical protein